jgi:hypothetical protein
MWAYKIERYNMADFITLSEVKTYGGINSNNQDTEIKFLIPKVCNLIRNYIGRTLIDYYRNEKVEVYRGGKPYLSVTEVPINEITSVEWSTDAGKTYTELVEFEDWTRNLEYDNIEVLQQDVFPPYVNGYRITYTGGYATVPEDLKLAALDLVVFYQRSDMAVKSARSAGSNNAQIEYVMNSTLPSHIRRVLDLYRLEL